jgi:hypothetical protein
MSLETKMEVCMSSEMMMVLIIAAVLGLVAFIAMKRNPHLEKYAVYAGILIPAAIVLLYLLFRKQPKNDPVAQQKATDEFAAKVIEVKDDLKEANTIATIKAKYAADQNTEGMKKLNEITKIQDKTVRRKKLIEENE